MKAFLVFSSLLATNFICAVASEQEEIHFTSDKTVSLFQHYLTTCHTQNIENRPVHLRNASREKQSSFTDMIILDMNLPSTMHINDMIELIYHSDADIVHLTNASTEQAMCLFEILGQTYPHFIYAPNEKEIAFVASKYPLSQAVITRIAQDNGIKQDLLEFSIHGAHIHHAAIRAGDLSTKIVDMDNMNNDRTTVLIPLPDLPITLTVVKQQYASFSSAQEINFLQQENFQILPIRHGESDDRGGYSATIEIERSWGGKDGGSWEASATVEAYDGRGNYVEAEARHNDRGEGSVSARAGHEDR